MSPAFRKLLAANIGLRLTDELCNAKTSLPWLLALAGAPAPFLALLVPLREGLSMLPQMFLNPWFMQRARRKQFWIKAALLQGICALLMPGALLLQSPVWAGIVVVLLLMIFSVARSVCSLLGKELAAKSVESDNQGKLTGLTLGFAGPLVMGAGLTMLLLHETDNPQRYFVALFLAASICGLLAAWSMSRLVENDSETTQQKNSFLNVFTSLQDPRLQLLIAVRVLLFCPVLALPFMVAALADDESHLSIIGGFIVINGVVSTVAAPFWGRLADYSARLSLALGGIISVCSVAFYGAAILPMGVSNKSVLPWQVMGLYGLLVAGYTGVRVGRKTWVVTLQGAEFRNRMIAGSNTVVGLLLLAIAVLGSVLGDASRPLFWWVLAAAGLVGAGLAWKLQQEETSIV